MHSSALVWSMGYKGGHIAYSMLEGWQQKGRNLVDSVRENYGIKPGISTKPGKKGSGEVTTRVQKGGIGRKSRKSSMYLLNRGSRAPYAALYCKKSIWRMHATQSF